MSNRRKADREHNVTGLSPNLNSFLQISQWILFFDKTKNKPKRNTKHYTLAVSSESRWFSICEWRTPVGAGVWERKFLQRPPWSKCFPRNCWQHLRLNRREMLYMYIYCHFQWSDKYTVIINRIKIPLNTFMELLLFSTAWYWQWVFWRVLESIGS